MQTIIVVSNVETKEYFFAESHTNYNLGKNWVPVSHFLPHPVKPRKILPSGIVESKQDLINIYYNDGIEIPFDVILDKITSPDFFPKD